MKALLYTSRNTRHHVFETIDFEPDWGDQDMSEWLRSAGFSMGLPYGSKYGLSIRVSYAEDASHGYAAIVTIEEDNATGVVLVESNADLLALRIALAPLALFQLLVDVDEADVLLTKLFAHVAGHDRDVNCGVCRGA